eukprot:270985-Prorocentrum_minimum.AAC.1
MARVRSTPGCPRYMSYAHTRRPRMRGVTRGSYGRSTGMPLRIAPLGRHLQDAVEWFIKIGVLVGRVPILPPIPCELTLQEWPDHCPNPHFAAPRYCPFPPYCPKPDNITPHFAPNLRVGGTEHRGRNVCSIPSNLGSMRSLASNARLYPLVNPLVLFKCPSLPPRDPPCPLQMPVSTPS